MDRMVSNAPDIVNDVSRFLLQEAAIAAGSRIVVALSGGADSVALLHVLHDCRRWPLTAAHCNFHLRGEESDRDERFCRELCATMGIDLLVKQFDVEARCRATGESIEMACRELRYGWFDTLRRDLPAAAVAVAHHADDNVETLLLNLTRGTGPAGLCGIPPVREDSKIVRPLLRFTRRQLLDYLAANALSHITDSTNAGIDFRRNRLRHIALPALSEAIPGAREGMLATIGHMSESVRLYRSLLRQAREGYSDPTGAIDCARLLSEQGAEAQLMLFEWLRHEGFSRRQTDDMLHAASGSRFTSRTGAVMVKDRHRLCPFEQEEAPLPALIIKRMAMSEFPSMMERTRAGEVMLADIAILEGEPSWEVRRPRRGDRIDPFGMRGSKKLSDLFRDAKLSDAAKRNQCVVTRCGTVLWVWGMRASRHFPVRPDAAEFVAISLSHSMNNDNNS